MITFAWPWLLVFIPLPLLIFLLPKKNKSNTSAALIVPLLVKNTHTEINNQPNKKAPLLVLSVCWLLTVLALSQPQWLGDAIDIPTEAREMMIAVDLSNSMNESDMSINGSNVTRLNMLKVVLSDFIERRVGDKLGLILFADGAYMQTPMTFDRKTVKQMLDESQIGLVGRNTAIGDAIGLAVKRFDAKQKTNKVLLLLTDGQNTAGKLLPDQALELAVAKGITIYTIGIGAEVMLKQSFFGPRRVNPSGDLDENMLTKLAKQTGGKYFRAKDSEGMNQIYQLLDLLEPLEQEQQQMRPLTALFYYPLALALLISLLYILAINISIFNRKKLGF